MNTKLELAGVPMVDLRVAELLECLKAYLQTPALNVTAMVHMDTITAAEKCENVQNCLCQADLTIPADSVLLEELGITDEEELREIEDMRLLQELLQFCAETGSRIFLLADDSIQLQELESYMKESYTDPELAICGGYSLETAEGVSERIVNEINSAAPDMVLSVLSTPFQENFLMENKMMLNARLWFGAGADKGLSEEQKLSGAFYQRIISKRMIKKYKNRGNA